jgi:hypothetical protein
MQALYLSLHSTCCVFTSLVTDPSNLLSFRAHDLTDWRLTPCNHVTIFYLFCVNFNILISHLRLSLEYSPPPPWFYKPVIFVNKTNMQCSPASCYFLFRRCKYSLHILVLMHGHPTFPFSLYPTVCMQIKVLKSSFLSLLETISAPAYLMKTFLHHRWRNNFIVKILLEATRCCPQQEWRIHYNCVRFCSLSRELTWLWHPWPSITHEKAW